MAKKDSKEVKAIRTEMAKPENKTCMDCGEKVCCARFPAP
jgi:hypothetical protein